MINYGVVYPQSILVFTIIMLYSVVQPLIVIFGAIYFGVAYVVLQVQATVRFVIPNLPTIVCASIYELQCFINRMNLKAKPGPSHSSASSGEL